MSNTHPIVAAPWQLGRRLGLMLLPLVPEPRDCGRTWVWAADPIDLFWFKSEGVGDRLLKKLSWQVGDRIYLQEPWCEFDDLWFTESTCPEAECVGWQPAHTMPEAAAEYWYEIADVRVCQCKDLSVDSLIASGLIDPGSSAAQYSNVMEPLDIGPDNPNLLAHAAQAIKTAQCCKQWNSAYSRYRWEKDLHLVALQVNPVIFETPKQVNS